MFFESLRTFSRNLTTKTSAVYCSFQRSLNHSAFNTQIAKNRYR